MVDFLFWWRLPSPVLWCKTMWVRTKFKMVSGFWKHETWQDSVAGNDGTLLVLISPPQKMQGWGTAQPFSDTSTLTLLLLTGDGSECCLHKAAHLPKPSSLCDFYLRLEGPDLSFPFTCLSRFFFLFNLLQLPMAIVLKFSSPSQNPGLYLRATLH